MNIYAKYIRFKTLKEFYDNLSDEDKNVLASMSKDRLPAKNEQPISYVQCKDPYWRGVSQNVVGDALYDVGLHVIKSVIKQIKL